MLEKPYDAAKQAANYIANSADKLSNQYKLKIEDEISRSFIRYDIDELDEVVEYLKSPHIDTNTEGQSDFASTTNLIANKMTKGDKNLPTIDEKIKFIEEVGKYPRIFGNLPAQQENESDENYITKIATLLSERSNQLEKLDEKDYDPDNDFSDPKFSKMRDAISTMGDQYVQLANGCNPHDQEEVKKRDNYLSKAKQCYDMNFDYNFGIKSIFQRFKFYVKQGLWGALSRKKAAAKLNTAEDFASLKEMAQELEQQLIQQEQIMEEGSEAIDKIDQVEGDAPTTTKTMNAEATFMHNCQSHQEKDGNKTRQNESDEMDEGNATKNSNDFNRSSSN